MSIIILLYFLCTVLLTFYGINCHVMVHLFKRRYRERVRADNKALSEFYGGRLPVNDPDSAPDRLPKVTTQLPIFNELNVAERIIDAVAAFVAEGAGGGVGLMLLPGALMVVG